MPGSAIQLKFDKDQVTSRQDNSQLSLNADTFKTYKSTVKWYKILEEERAFSSVNIGLELK